MMKQEVRLTIGKRSYVAKNVSTIRNITASFSSGVSVRQRACASTTITKACGRWISAQEVRNGLADNCSDITGDLFDHHELPHGQH